MQNTFHHKIFSAWEELHDFLISVINRIRFLYNALCDSLNQRKKLLRDILGLSLIFALLFVAYFAIDKRFPFYERTKLVAEFKIDGQTLKFPSTTTSLLTTLLCSILLTCVIQILITKSYFKYKSKKACSINPRLSNPENHNAKNVIITTFVCCLCEALRNVLREINYSFKTVYTKIAIVTLIVCLFIGFGSSIISRILASIRGDVIRQLNPDFYKKPYEKINIDPKSNIIKQSTIKIRNSAIYRSVAEPCKKVFNKRALLAIFICSVITLGATFGIQEIEQSKTWKVPLPTINGNSINLLDNKDNILFTMFIEMLLLTIVLKIVGQLAKQAKIRTENDNFDIKNRTQRTKNLFSDMKNATHHTLCDVKGMCKTIGLTVLTVISSNVLTSMRRTMAGFENKGDFCSWLLCFVIVIVAFLISTFCIMYNINEIGASETRKNQDEKINTESCLICQKPHWRIFKQQDDVLQSAKY